MKHLKDWDRLKWHRGIPHDRLDWFVLDVTLRKHSDLVEQSNFAMVISYLGGRSRDVEVHHLPGLINFWWTEIILVNPYSKLVGFAKELEAGARNYDVISDSDLSRRYLESRNKKKKNQPKEGI